MQPQRARLTLSGGSELSFLTAGDPANPALLLLHGMPSSAQTFRDVIPELAEVAYVIAPDLPGYGESDVLLVPTFTAFGQAVTELLEHLEVDARYLYLHDYGAPVALHIALQSPDRVLGLIIQNANAHLTGMGPTWAATQAFWADPTPENEKAATAHLTFEGVRDQYLSGVPPEVAARIAPQTWQEDWRVMNLPGRMETQRALVRDYGRYVQRFESISEYLRGRQPRAMLLWGRHDPFFALQEVQTWMQELPRMEAHVFDGGHFLLETHAAVAARLIVEFIVGHQTRT